MKRKILIIIMFFFVIFIYHMFNSMQMKNQTTIQFFPENQNVHFVEHGSKLEMLKKNHKSILLTDVWSKTNEKTSLRQDVYLLFRNGMLVAKGHPWKEDSDWMKSRLEYVITKDNSIYTLITYHYAEIHEGEIITNKQLISSDKLYVTYFQGAIESFRKPQNVRQVEVADKLKQIYSSQRSNLLEKGIYELNINQSNYDIYDLDTFSIQDGQDHRISEEQLKTALNRLWQGIYKYYILDNNGSDKILPPMPWVLLDKESTHILVLFQRSNGAFEKLLLQL